jgi:hypothetical protein
MSEKGGRRRAQNAKAATPPPAVSVLAKGRAAKKNGAPRPPWHGPWLVGRSESEAKKGPGSDLLFFISFVVFFAFPRQEASENVTNKNREKNGFVFLVEFLVKTFRHDFFCKTLFVVFLNSHRGKTPENAINQKKSRKN